MQVFQHFALASRVVLLYKALYKWGTHPRRRDAITPDVVAQVVPGHGIGHGQDGAFAHGVGKTIRNARRTGNRGQVENYSPAVALHRFNAGEHAVVSAL